MIHKVTFTLGLVMIFLFSSLALAQTQKLPADSDQQITDFSLSGFGDKGKKNWDLSGQSANIITDTVQLKNVVGNLYNDQENIKLTADTGDYNKKDGQVHLENNVLISTSSGARLSTNSLNWDRKNQVVATKDSVNIERDNMITTALGAVGHPNLSRVSLEKDVKMKIDVDQNPIVEGKDKEQKSKITITCDGPMEINYQQNVATFNKKVKVQTKDATMYSDKMEVYFLKSDTPKAASGVMSANAMGSKVDKIRAFGNVTIIQGENVSQSQEAEYNASTNKITLAGKPKLVIYSDTDMDKALSSR
jgi:LPS export ABC transporter protein LptC